jgi:hypothetical protein
MIKIKMNSCSKVVVCWLLNKYALVIEKIGNVQIVFVCMGQQRKFGKVIGALACAVGQRSILTVVVIANNWGTSLSSTIFEVSSHKQMASYSLVLSVT